MLHWNASQASAMPARRKTPLPGNQSSSVDGPASGWRGKGVVKRTGCSGEQTWGATVVQTDTMAVYQPWESLAPEASCGEHTGQHALHLAFCNKIRTAASHHACCFEKEAAFLNSADVPAALDTAFSPFLIVLCSLI